MTLRMRTSAPAFQSPFGAEAVAVGHEPLDGDAGQLAQPAEVFERVGEGAEPAFLEERAERHLDPCGVAQLVVAGAADAQRLAHVVRGFVLRDGAVDSVVGRAVHGGRQLVHAVAVDRKPEPRLGLDLVALGDRDLAHVVAEAGDPKALRFVPARRCPRPPAQASRDRRVIPVAHDRLPASPEPRLDERELAVTVGRLVEVHEVHVDLRPRQIAVELRVQVDERLAQVRQPADPHLGGREGVHPGDDPDARVGRVGGRQHPGDLVRRRHHALGDDPDRDVRGFLEALAQSAARGPRPFAARPVRRGAGCP